MSNEDYAKRTGGALSVQLVRSVVEVEENLEYRALLYHHRMAESVGRSVRGVRGEVILD